jgi:hypothetical protein
MTRRFVPPPPELVAELRLVAERRLSAAEFEAYVAAPMSAEEHQQLVELIDWFMTRYPTPAARLAQARRSYLAATALAPERIRALR